MGRFGGHAELDNVEDDLQRGLILLVAAGDADREHRFAVAQHQRGRQGCARPLAGFDAVGMAAPGIENDQTCAMRDPGCSAAAGLAGQSAGRAGHHITPAIGDGADGRAAHRRVGAPAAFEQSAHCIGIAGADFTGGMTGIDQPPAQRGVGVGKQLLEWHLDKTGIAVILIAIGQSQLHRFGDGMDIIGRVCTHCGQIIALQQAQALQEVRPLGPWPAFTYRIAPVIDGDRFLDQGLMCGEIGFAQKAALFDVPFFQIVGDVAAVKTVRHGLKFLLAASPGLLFRLCQFADRAGQIGIPVPLHIDGIAIRCITIPGRPSRIENLEGRCRGLGKAFTAIPLQRRHANSDHRRHRGGLDIAAGNAMGKIPVDRLWVQWRSPLPVEHLHPAAAGLVDHERHLPADAKGTDGFNAQRQQGCHRGVGGIPSLLQHPQAGPRGLLITGCDSPFSAGCRAGQRLFLVCTTDYNQGGDENQQNVLHFSHLHSPGRDWLLDEHFFAHAEHMIALLQHLAQSHPDLVWIGTRPVTVLRRHFKGIAMLWKDVPRLQFIDQEQ